MPLTRILRKASNFILRSQPGDSSATPSYSDGEVVFCKNNVCVHPPALIRQETDILHHPGYLTVTCHMVDDKRTLFLSWIPNTTLRRHPSTVEKRSLSVTRAGESYSNDGEVRRLSASSLPVYSRRNSSGSFETECIGCFPENQTNLSPQTPQMHLKNHESRTYRSSSLSSTSDNNSLCFTPTDSIKDYNITPSDNEKIESEKLNNKIKFSLVEDKSVVINDCDDLVRKNCSITTIDVSTDFSTEQDSSILQTQLSLNPDSYRSYKCSSNENSSNINEGSVVLTNNIDQIDVPNLSKDLISNVENIQELGEENITKKLENNSEVPNKNPVNNLVSECCNDSKIKNDISENSSSEINESDKSHYEQKSENCKSYLIGAHPKEVNCRYTFTRSDGIVYIDSLVLRENPHLLNNVNGSNNDSTETSNDCRHKNDSDSFVMKRNIDNLKVDSKKLPLRSFEENFGPSWMSSPELLALKHNLTFPDSVTASPVIRQTQRCCRKFCVDLSQMRSLRLFFSDAESTKGQLVIASRECQYKILHFHHSGLERLATVLQQWHLLTVVPHGDNLPYRHFMVCKPAVHDTELHPEEGKVCMVAMADWLELLNPLGQVEDDLALRKGIFLGGLDPSLRKTVWPFLLHCFSYQSTAAEREQILTIRRQEYEQIKNRRLSLEGAAKERFLRNIQCVVEKDVIRTDRGNPYYAGESNPHVETMKNILLNYAVYDAGLGYLQGMSDLLAPLLAEIGLESDTFWCFVGLMRRTIFVCTPTDSDMERNLSYLRELIREMVPEFYKHLQRHTDAMELLFCHRWILLCFKREFPEEMALKMWEACWANYLTDYFNLFLCLAIVSAYADDVIAQDLRTDEMLLHFSSLAMFMDGELILRKARGLLYQFRQRPVIPCTLAGLCMQCGPGMWDSGHAPTIECRGNDYCKQNPCLYRGISSSLS